MVKKKKNGGGAYNLVQAHFIPLSGKKRKNILG